MNLQTRENRLTIKKAALFLLAIPVLLFIFMLRTRLETYLFEGMIISAYSETAAIRSRVLLRKYEKALPLSRKEAEEMSLNSRAGAAVLIKHNGNEKVLFEKNIDEPLPLASLTKLMTALIVLENYNLDQAIVFSKEAVEKQGEPNFFRAGESFYVNDLLYSALVESSNRAAYALSEILGERAFVSEMNRRAAELGMEKAKFFNPTGLDPDLPGEGVNWASAEDLILLAENLIERPLVGQMCRTESRAIHQTNGDFHHIIETTNELLGEMPNIALAKTGHTPMAGECLLIVLEKPDYGVVVNVILGSEDSFLEMEELVNWVDSTYKW